MDLGLFYPQHKSVSSWNSTKKIEFWTKTNQKYSEHTLLTYLLIEIKTILSLFLLSMRSVICFVSKIVCENCRLFFKFLKESCKFRCCWLLATFRELLNLTFRCEIIYFRCFDFDFAFARSFCFTLFTFYWGIRSIKLTLMINLL